MKFLRNIFLFLLLSLGLSSKAFAVNYITAVGTQQVTVTIATGATSGSATVSAVGSGAFLMYGAFNTTGTAPNTSHVGVTLTNSTTITATRTTSGGVITIKVSVVDGTPSLITSVQFGTATITTGNATGTATISSVSANTAVLQYLGDTTSDATDAMATQYPKLSYSGTTVTATVPTVTTSNLVVYFCVIEFASGAMNQNVQSYSKSWTSGTSATQTITSVNTSNTLLFWAGRTSTATTSYTMGHSYAVLTNATTVTVNNTTTLTATTNEFNFFVVEFIAGIFNQAVQRGTIVNTGTTSNTATITSVSTTASGCHAIGFQTASSTQNKMLPSMDLTNATTVTSTKGNVAQNCTEPYEVAEWIPFSAASSLRTVNSAFDILLED